MTSGGIKTLNYPVAQSCHFVNVFLYTGGSLWDFLLILNSTFKITDFNMLAKSMEPFVLTLVLIGFIIFTDRPMLEYTSYCAGMEFESPLVYEFIGSSYVSTEFDFNQEYG